MFSLQVRPPPTAVHMVQLPPNPATNSHVPTANGISSGTPPLSSGRSQSSAAGGNPTSDHQNASGGVSSGGSGGVSGGMDAGGSAGSGGSQQATDDDDTSKGATSASEDSMPFTTSSSTIPAAVSEPGASSAGRSSTGADSGGQVTLLSTPAVSIFQVAHRPNTSGGGGGGGPAGINASGGFVGSAVLQPVLAVTGFNLPACRTTKAAAPLGSAGPAQRRGRALTRVVVGADAAELADQMGTFV